MKRTGDELFLKRASTSDVWVSLVWERGNGEGVRLFYMIVFLNSSGLFLSPKVPPKKRSISSKWVRLALSQTVSFQMVRAQC